MEMGGKIFKNLQMRAPENSSVFSNSVLLVLLNYLQLVFIIAIYS